jgi:hypothetical protein
MLQLPRSTDRRAGRPSRTRSSPAKNSPSSPPQFDAAILCSHRFRFIADEPLVDKLITASNLQQLLVACINPTTTTAIPLVSAYKIRRVHIWGPPAADLTPVTVSIEFVQGTGNTGARPSVYSDISVGATRNAHVSAAPPLKSATSQWQNVQQTGGMPSTGAQFILNGPQSSIVDVELSFVLANGETPTPLFPTTGTVLGVACLSLDGIAGSLIPVSYATAN